MIPIIDSDNILDIEEPVDNEFVLPFGSEYKGYKIDTQIDTNPPYEGAPDTGGYEITAPNGKKYYLGIDSRYNPYDYIDDIINKECNENMIPVFEENTSTNELAKLVDVLNENDIEYSVEPVNEDISALWDADISVSGSGVTISGGISPGGPRNGFARLIISAEGFLEFYKIFIQDSLDDLEGRLDPTDIKLLQKYCKF